MASRSGGHGVCHRGEHLFLEGDERYRKIVLVTGPNADTWETNLK